MTGMVVEVVERPPAMLADDRRHGGDTMNQRELIEAVRQAQRTSPEPPHVRQSRDRYDRGERLGDDRQSRPWYCRSCGHTAHGPVIPAGRYSVIRHSVGYDVKPALPRSPRGLPATTTKTTIDTRTTSRPGSRARERMELDERE